MLPFEGGGCQTSWLCTQWKCVTFDGLFTRPLSPSLTGVSPRLSPLSVSATLCAPCMHHTTVCVLSCLLLGSSGDQVDRFFFCLRLPFSFPHV